MSVEEALLELKQAEQAKDSAESLKIVAEALGKLSDNDRRKLLDLPSVQKLINDAEQKAASAMRPGSVICDDAGRVLSKVPWTAQAMKEAFGLVRWTPLQSRLISVNGVDVWVEKGVPIETPPQFESVAMEAWRSEESKLQTDKEIVKRNFGDNGLVLNGDGTPA